MKKRIFYYALGALTFTACTSDDLGDVNNSPGQNTDVTFKIALPASLQSRAINDTNNSAGKGAEINRLHLTVFSQDGQTKVYDKVWDDAFAGTNTTQDVTITLVNGETYDIAFWADNADGGYTYTDGIVTVDYSSLNANDEKRDAFYKYYDDYKAGASDAEVHLSRAVAQLNVACSPDDEVIANSLGLSVTHSRFDISFDTYTTLDIKTGGVDGATAKTVAFAKTARPTGQIEVNSKLYNYLGYVYVLASEGGETLNQVEFFFNDNDDARTFAPVPVKRNYRTNIVGNILTTPHDFSVILDTEFTDDITPGYVDYMGNKFFVDNTPWDGFAIDAPYTATINGTDYLLIGSAAQMAGLEKMVNIGSITQTRAVGDELTYTGQNVVLLCDINLDNHPWKPMGPNADSKRFNSVLDGNGHTIKNLNVNQEAAYHAAGLIGALNGTVKNLTIDGATITSLSSGTATDNGTAVLAGSLYLSGTVDNVTIKNATVNGNRYVGGIGGYCKGSVTNCTIENLMIVDTPDNLSGSYDNGDKAGGVVGFVDGSCVIDNNKLKNVSITAARDFGGIVGCTPKASQVTNNMIDGLTLIRDISLLPGLDKINMGMIIGRNTGKEEVSTSNVATNVTMSAYATPATFSDIMNQVSGIVDITLQNGDYAMPKGAQHSRPTIGDDDLLQAQEGRDFISMSNLKAGTKVTLTGESKDGVKIYWHMEDKVAGQQKVDYMIYGADITFKNMTLYRHEKTIMGANIETYDNCNIIGMITPKSYQVDFKNCSFTTPNSTWYDVWGSKDFCNYPAIYNVTARYLNFTDCSFNLCTNKSIQIYAANKYYVVVDVTATNCTFNSPARDCDNGGTKPRAVFETHNERGIHGSLTIKNCTWDNSNGNWRGGLFWDGAWPNTPRKYFTVTVDGVVKQNADDYTAGIDNDYYSDITPYWL